MDSALFNRGADLKSSAASILLTMTGIYDTMQTDLAAMKVRVRQGVK
jgi:hypothetical protein